LDKALKDKSLSNVKVDFENEDLKKNVRKRAFIKNINQKTSFILESVPLFNTFNILLLQKL
jgi:hypothetical protein